MDINTDGQYYVTIGYDYIHWRILFVIVIVMLKTI